MVKSTTTTTTDCIPPMASTTRKRRQYKGVRMRSWGSWVSEIRAPIQKTRIWLGSYSTPEAAARAYDAALLCLKGSTAALNFPDSPPLHLPPSLMSPKSIQTIAAAAANATTTTTTTTTTSSSITSSPCPSFDTADDDVFTVSSGSGISDTVEEETAPFKFPVDFGFFESPKCIDQLLDHWAMLEPPQVDDCDDYEGHIRLWSFC